MTREVVGENKTVSSKDVTLWSEETHVDEQDGVCAFRVLSKKTPLTNEEWNELVRVGVPKKYIVLNEITRSCLN